MRTRVLTGIFLSVIVSGCAASGRSGEGEGEGEGAVVALGVTSNAQALAATSVQNAVGGPSLSV